MNLRDDLQLIYDWIPEGSRVLGLGCGCGLCFLEGSGRSRWRLMNLSDW